MASFPIFFEKILTLFADFLWMEPIRYISGFCLFFMILRAILMIIRVNSPYDIK